MIASDDRWKPSVKVDSFMATLLVLGSKPDPILPAREEFDEVACANASGFSAVQNKLPTPTYTVMSSILTSGKNASNNLALKALIGLQTGVLYIYPWIRNDKNLIKRMKHFYENYKTKPFYIKSVLKKLDYNYENIVSLPLQNYLERICGLCDHDPDIREAIRRKVPSSGVVAIALGVEQVRYERIIVSGFSFEITHAYAENPLIKDRGTVASKHADTDIAIVKHLCERSRRVFTTEPVVNERAGVPLLHGSRAKPASPSTSVAEG